MVEITMLNLNMRSKNLVIIGLFLAYIITCIIALCLGDENLSPKELLSYAFVKMKFCVKSSSMGVCLVL